jgi:hypothetical protein
MSQPKDRGHLRGEVTVELFGADGELKHREVIKNLITDTGDKMYAANGAGVASPPAKPTGMKLGTGANSGGSAPSKSGAGAALVTYLSGSDVAFDSTPTMTDSDSGAVVTYAATWVPGVATTSNPITEAVIVNDTLTNATSAASATVARVAISGVSAKASTDQLVITWTHTLLGA